MYFFFVLTYYSLYFRPSNWINQIYFTDKLNKCVCREREKNYIVIIFLKHKVMDNALQFYFCCQLLYKAWPIGTTILLFSFLLRKKRNAMSLCAIMWHMGYEKNSNKLIIYRSTQCWEYFSHLKNKKPYMYL